MHLRIFVKVVSAQTWTPLPRCMAYGESEAATESKAGAQMRRPAVAASDKNSEITFRFLDRPMKLLFSRLMVRGSWFVVRGFTKTVNYR
jgi:hypothetical protein|eukprot:COSAG01_NODE_7530_length_3164_cov_21.004241_3_plen_89_part_00